MVHGWTGRLDKFMGFPNGLNGLFTQFTQLLDLVNLRWLCKWDFADHETKLGV